MRSWPEALGSEAAAFAFILCLLAASASVYVLIRRFHRDRDDQLVLAGIAMVIGPIVLAYLASLLLRLAPADLPSKAYLMYPLTLLVLCGALALRLPRRGRTGVSEGERLAENQNEGWALRHLGLLAAIVLIAGHIAMTVLSTLAPVFGNDSVEYATTGRLLAQFRSMEHFPFVDRAITGGFVAPFTHPPAHVTLIALAYLFQGNVQVDGSEAGAVKLIAAYFAAAHSVLIVGFAGWSRPRAAGFIAALLVLGAPMYALLTVENSLDPMRISAFTATVAAVWLLLRHQTTPLAILCGVACGCASFTHSIGLLTIGLVLPAYLILAQTSWTKRLLYSGLIALITIPFVAPTLADNIEVFGTPLQDRSPAWDIPLLRYDEFLSITRGLETSDERIVFGLFRAFTEPQWMGYAFWVFAACVLLAIFTSKASALRNWVFPEDVRKLDPVVISALIVGGYFSMLTLTVLADSVTAIKNPRYVMTVLPLAALVAARILAYAIRPAAMQDRAGA